MIWSLWLELEIQSNFLSLSLFLFFFPVFSFSQIKLLMCPHMLLLAEFLRWSLILPSSSTQNCSSTPHLSFRLCILGVTGRKICQGLVVSIYHCLDTAKYIWFVVKKFFFHYVNISLCHSKLSPPTYNIQDKPLPQGLNL